MLADMLPDIPTSDRYAARTVFNSNFFEVVDTRTGTVVIGSAAVSERVATDMVRRLNEIYRGVVSDAANSRRQMIGQESFLLLHRTQHRRWRPCEARPCESVRFG